MKILYDLRCPQCGAADERYCKYEDIPLQQCPVCSAMMEKAMTAPAFSLQGADYYKPAAYMPKVENKIGNKE